MKYKYETGENVKRSKNFEKRKKFIMELLGDPLYKPMRLREIASLLQLDKSEKKELFDVLDELCAQGKAEVDNKGRYSKVSGKRRDRRNPHGRNFYWPLQRFWLCGSGGSGTGYFYSGK